jgi:hypothetical protein
MAFMASSLRAQTVKQRHCPLRRRHSSFEKPVKPLKDSDEVTCLSPSVALLAAHATQFAIPSYFHFAMNQDAIVGFFQELADASPIPIVIYNFPGVVAGLDVNSEMLDILGKHKNIVGVKLTCGGIAKVSRISASFEKSEFVALAGQSDWLIPALSVGAVGTITGVANLFPKVSHSRLHDFSKPVSPLLDMHSYVRPLPTRKARRSISLTNQAFGHGMGFC